MSLRFRVLLLFSLAGLVINALLLWWKLADSTVAGCGGGGGCNEVLASRWSQVLGLPVPVLGILVYLVLPWAILRRNNFIAAFCYASIAGSAVWLILVQALLLHHFCPWCMAAHVVGISLALVGISSGGISRRGLQSGLAAAFALALVQIIGPTPATHRIDSDLNAATSEFGGIHARGNGRKIAFDDGKRIYDNSSLPGLGFSDAPHVLVEYFDFQCPACRTMSGYLTALIAKHPSKIQVLLLPVPLNHGCNPALDPMDEGHSGSCELTRIALAVWRVRPEVYPAIHQAFLADPPPDQIAAMSLAGEQVDPARLQAAMRDPWVDQLIQANITDWIAFSGKSKKLPKLLISGKRILHGLPSGEADFIRVMEKELGL